MKIMLPLEQITRSNTGFTVPEDVVLGLGAGKRPPVLVTVDGEQIQTRIAPMGGCYLIGLTKANHGLLGVQVGRTYELTIELDTAERTVEVPEDLAEALGQDAVRQQTWDTWSYTRRNEAARSLADAKKPDTRARRLQKIITALDG